MTLHLLIAESSGLGGLFTALGLNLQAFILDLLAFLVTAYVVGRYVFPPLTKALDAKKEELEAASRQEDEAKKALEKAGQQAAQTLSKARDAADEILAGAHADAAEQLETARVKAQAQTERMVREAREQLARDVQTARRELKTETAKLVAGATEKVLNEKLDSQHDAALIGRSLETK